LSLDLGRLCEYGVRFVTSLGVFCEI